MANYQMIARDELRLGALLAGDGTFGSIYRGGWITQGKLIAVTLRQIAELRREVDILCKMHHPNIIETYGVSEISDHEFLLVTEFAERGSLFDYLHKRKYLNVDTNQITSWALQIAHGIEYVHYDVPVPIIHSNLTSRSILLSAERVCKLCDFGFSKNFLTAHSFTPKSFIGTTAWMSPEIIKKKDAITTATDIWSYAVVLWEMLTREIPYDGLAEYCIVREVTKNGGTLVVPEHCPLAFKRLFTNCWKIDARERYDIRQVMNALNVMRTTARFEVKSNQPQYSKLVGKIDEFLRCDAVRNISQKSEQPSFGSVQQPFNPFKFMTIRMRIQELSRNVKMHKGQNFTQMNDAKLERLRGRYEYVRAAVNNRSVEVPRETTDS